MIPETGTRTQLKQFVLTQLVRQPQIGDVYTLRQDEFARHWRVSAIERGMVIFFRLGRAFQAMPQCFVQESEWNYKMLSGDMRFNRYDFPRRRRSLWIQA